MISVGQWAAYNAAVESIRQGASSAVEAEVSAWCAAHAGATVEEAREAAKAILSGHAQAYDKAAAALAAEWYDAQGRAAGMKLDRAVTAAAYDAGGVDRVARYRARKYAEGDLAGFAAMCGEYAANDAMRSVNKTILKNVGRDRKWGVKFARVTSGRNTCAFCLMLAGRGAVYHSRRSAGEMNRYHRHCACKVVPCFSGNQYEVLVEGHDPKEAESLWSKVVELEAMDGVAADIKQCAKNLMSANASLEVDEALAVIERLGGRVPPASDEIAEWSDGKKFSKHAKKHAATFGLDYTTADGRAGYDRLFSDTMGAWDAVAFDDGMSGQKPDECVFYFKGDTVAIVNAVTGKRVSLFRHERGASEYIDRIWDKAHG